jgi:hypothetical protein
MAPEMSYLLPHLGPGWQIFSLPQTHIRHLFSKWTSSRALQPKSSHPHSDLLGKGSQVQLKLTRYLAAI